MSQELHYTSAPRGLWPGSQGYCTVACTAQMPRSLAERLEGLSAYRNIFPPHDPLAAQNPVVFSHLRVSIAGVPRHVLSRVGFAGLDYTERTNKYAHHVVLDPSELPRGGPAWLLSQPGFLRNAWDGNIGWIESPHPVPRGDVRPSPCRAWEQAAGDAGWAGVLAETFLAGTKPVVYLIHEPGQDILPLVLEAQALLPPERRWELTFSTYFTTLPQGVVCAWRGVVRGTPEEAQARRAAGQALVLDVNRSPGQARGGPLVEQARTGRPSATRFPTHPAPPTLPAGTVPGSDAPIVLQPLPTASAFGVIPDLPTPPALRSSDRPRQWSGTSRSRRARVIVATVCLLLLLAGGGIGALLFLKRDQVKNLGQVAQNAAPSQSGGAPRQDPVNPSAPATVQSDSAQGGGSAVEPPKQPVVDTVARSVTTEPAPANSGRTETFKPQGAVGSRSENGQPADQKARNGQDASVGASAVAAGPKSNQRPNVANSAPKGATMKPAEVLWIELPYAGDFVDPMDLTILSTAKPHTMVNLELKGLRDAAYAPYSLKSVAFEFDRKSGLRIVSDMHNKEKEIATFSLRDQHVIFRWGNNITPTYREHIQVIRSCVLEIRCAEDEPSKRVVLRKRVSQPNPLSMSQLWKGQTIDWGPSGRPFGRDLMIGESTWGNTSVRTIVRATDPSGRSCTYQFGNTDRPSLRLELVQPNKPDSQTKDYLMSAFEPSEKTLRTMVATKLDQLEKNTPSPPNGRNSEERQGKSVAGSFEELKNGRHECFIQIRNEITRQNIRPQKLRFIIGQFNNKELQIGNLVNDNDWRNREKSLCSELNDVINLAANTCELRSKMDNERAELSVSVLMKIEGEPFEVATFGSPSREVKREKPGPAARPKR